MVNQASLRLQKEYKSIVRDPVANLVAHPSPNNILDWHYVLKGGEGTDYEGGYYHGKVVFPEQYPFKPPAISVVTPSGRFHTNMRLCLSMSDFHPETWNPMWSVSTILTGLMSFMYDDVATTGSMHVSSSERRRLAKESVQFNLKSPVFCKVFPDLVIELKSILEARALEEKTLEGAKKVEQSGADGGLHPPQEHNPHGASGYGRQKAPGGEGLSFGAAALIFLLLAVISVPILNLNAT